MVVPEERTERLLTAKQEMKLEAAKQTLEAVFRMAIEEGHNGAIYITIDMEGLV